MLTRRQTLKALAVVACVILLPTCCVLGFRNQVAVGVSRDRAPRILALPADASNVSYFVPGAFGPNMFCEFDTTEAGFLAWVASAHNPERFTSTPAPFEVSRFNYRNNPPPDERVLDHQVADGIQFRWSEEDRGSVYSFDRQAGRAYYHSHSR